MATRKWVAEDGEKFDTKPEVEAYEVKKPFIKYLQESIGTGGISAESIYGYFDKNFRVPAVRKHRKPPPPPVQPPPTSQSATAAPSPKKK